MAGPAHEFAPDNSGLAAERYLGQRPCAVEIDGQLVEFESPGDFPDLLLAYFFNKYGIQSDELLLIENQKLLRTTGLGKILTDALDKVGEDENGHDLLDQVFDEQLAPEMSAYMHDQIIERAVQFLPGGLDAEVFRDPGRHLT
jgi:hypothetical protein